MRAAWAAAGLLLSLHVSAQPRPVEILKSVGGLPAHIAGRFEDIAACQRAASGDYYVFDRRAQMVFSVPAALSQPKEIVGVGVEPGRVLRPSVFDMAGDRRFVIADAPYGRPRVQLFLESGARVGGFELSRSTAPNVTLDGVVVSGVGSVEYTGPSLFISLPETGALITEYSVDGRPIRSFGELRPTGHESDRDVHVALNTGRIVRNPEGGLYFVFLSGAPLYRKYDDAGRLVFERHIQGPELDDYVRSRPNVWPKRATPDVIPLVVPVVRAAAADGAGNLWIALSVPVTYVYDRAGERQRVVRFVAAGPHAPSSLDFAPDGTLLTTPGCYAFDPRPAAGAR
jgi:hypothetical protein